MKPLTFIFCLIVGLHLALDSLGDNPMKKGKPNLQPYASEMKKAKAGDVAAILQLGEVCQGGIMDYDEVKDYQRALKYYSTLAKYSPTTAQQCQLHVNLFKIYLMGGYGVPKNEALARQHHAQAFALVANTPLRYTFQPNIDFKDFFTWYDKAQGGDPQALLMMGRQYLEYGVHYANGLDCLQRAALPDAAYLKEKWEATYKHYRQYGHVHFDKALHFDMMQRHAQQGSSIARLEWATDGSATHLQGYKLSDDKIQQVLANFPATQPEMLFKALCLLQKHQNGIARIVTLRQLAAVPHGLDAEGAAQGLPLISEYKAFDARIATVEALGNEIGKNKSIKGIAIDPEAHRNSYYGEVSRYLQARTDVAQPLVKQLAGEKHFANYKNQMDGLLSDVLQKADNPRKLIDFQRAIENNAWLAQYAATLKLAIGSRLASLGIDSSNIAFYYERSTIDDAHFASFEQGKRFVRDMLGRLPKAGPLPRAAKKPDVLRVQALNKKLGEEQAKLVSYAKSKVISDVVGHEPSVEEIERFNKMAMNDPWLQPEATQRYFHYTSDSKNWFSGEVYRGNVLYYYKLMRLTGTDKYKLEIFAVANDESNLVFNAVVKAFYQPSPQQYEVNVYYARHKVYQWIPSDNDYLKVQVSANAERIEAVPVGMMAQFKDSNHGYAPDFAVRRQSPSDFSEKAAVRSAVRCFILEYHRALKPI